MLAQIIDEVTLELAHFCRRPDWDKTARTEFFNPWQRGLKRLFLSSPPVASSPTIQVWQSTDRPRVYGAAELLTLDEDFFLHEELGTVEKVISFAGWSVGPKTVKVTYTGGFLTGNQAGAPADLLGICMDQVKLEFERREAMGLQSQSLEGGSFSYAMGKRLDPSVKDRLQHFSVYPSP